MRTTRTDIMGMPITIEVVDERDAGASLDAAFAYLEDVDARFSTYKDESEISLINRGELPEAEYSDEMRDVFALCEKTKEETDGYFDMRTPDGRLDPSGVVKGWAVRNAARLLLARGVQDFMIEAAGDIAVSGKNASGESWSVGIRNPFERNEIVKVVYPHGKGTATSGSAIRGAHIYDPHDPSRSLDEVVSITVIGPDVLEADRYATAAFAMGRAGVAFIESKEGLEAYSIDKNGIATMTNGFAHYTAP